MEQFFEFALVKSAEQIASNIDEVNIEQVILRPDWLND